ncbi:hypothetical protein HPB50_018448 [Hyalomma asiaticum]|uniref:Uncharacterized protein n=1 Tax=Hyalomma asiaticum TaxID=266040 RepID=A0ACB7SV36_HYAAI|nr:hypothetical protein HPB50_018448 [Hyalomma asiaticum]
MMSPQQGSSANPSFLKLHFLLLHGSFASVKPFQGLFAVWLGASPTMIGLVTFAVCVVRLPLKVVICLLADVRHSVCMLIALAALAEGFLSFYMSFMRPTHSQHERVFELNTNYSNVATSPIICFPLRLKDERSGLAAAEMTCRLRCGCADDMAKYPNIDSVLNGTFLYEHQGRCVSSRSFDELFNDYYCETSDEYACRMQCRPANDVLSGSALWNYVAAYAVSGLSMSSLAPLSDAAAFMIIERTGRELPALYSSYRIWGAVGSGFMALVAGYVNEQSSDAFGSVDFTSGFYINASLSTLDMITILFVVIPRRMRRDDCVEAVDSLLSSPRSVLLLVTIFVVGFLSPVFSLLGFVYLQELGAGHALVGAVVAAQCLVGQLLSLSAAEAFFKRIPRSAVLSITLGASAVRCLAFALARETWHVIPAELAYGFWYGLFCASNAAYGCNEARLVAQATVQCVLGVALEEFGAGLGSLVGGLCFTHVGRRQTYLYFLAISLAYMLLHIPLDMYITAIERKAGRLDQLTSSIKATASGVHSPVADQYSGQMTPEVSEIHDQADIMASETASHAAPSRAYHEASTAMSAAATAVPSLLTLEFPHQNMTEDDRTREEYLKDMLGKPEAAPEGDQQARHDDGASAQPHEGAQYHEQPQQDLPLADEKTAQAPSSPAADVDTNAVGGAKDEVSPDRPNSPQHGSADVRKSKRRKSKGVGKTERRKKKASQDDENRERKQPESTSSKDESSAAVGATSSHEKKLAV